MAIKISSRNITFAIVSVIFLILILFNAFAPIQAKITDSLHGKKNVLNNIVIITIDDESINSIGRWPWDRSVYADMLGKIQNPKAVGFDLSFFEPNLKQGDDDSFNETLKGFDNIILASEISGNQIYKPIFNADHGYVNLITDSDGVVRSLKSVPDQEEMPFAFKVYGRAFNATSKEHGIYHINFADSPGSFRSIKAKDLLNGQPENFTGKIVLIGATAPDLHDTFVVPTSKGIEMSGVEIQANIIQNLILNNFIKKQNFSLTFLFAFILGLLGMFFLSKLKTHYMVLSVLGIIVLYYFLGIFLFNNFDYITNFFFPPLSLIVFAGSGVGINYLEEKKQTSYLTNAFGKYVNKDLLREIVEHKKELNLGGEKRTITVLFSDIRNFTSISEKLSPEALGNMINSYLTKMAEVILDNRGTIDKFIGDAIMAFWNAPVEEKDHAELACNSAISKIKALKKFNEELKLQGHDPIEIGCGIHTGEAFVGNFGSNDRFDYTALGDTVNISSRLEGLTKYYKVSIIVSESTHKSVKNRKNLIFRKLDVVKVKGKEKPLVIYELCVKPQESLNKDFEKALEIYFEGNFKAAKLEFEKILKKEDDGPTKLFIERCKENLKNPEKTPKDMAHSMDFK